MTEKKAKTAVIFIHIPKTAGTTLTEILERHYPLNKRYHLGAKVQKAITEFQTFDQTRRANIDALYGHMAYGLHTYLPRPAVYVTVLREPVERVISFYYFVKGNDQHYLHHLSQHTAVDIKAFIESQHTIMVDNFQVRLLSGVWDDVPFGGVTEEHCRLAKQNLENIQVVGLTKQFDATLLLVKDLLGWRHIWYKPRNVTLRRPKKRELPADMLASVVAHNQWDIELFRYAEELLAAQIAQKGALFAWRVRLFQFLNRPFYYYWEKRRALQVRLCKRMAHWRSRLGYES